MRNILYHIGALLFPSSCLHCNVYENQRGLLFCRECSAFFEYLDPSHNECIACFSYYESVATFVKRWKGGTMPYLSKVAASLLFMQLQKISWEECDLLIPVPSRHLIKRFDPLYNTACYLARLLRIEYGQVIYRKKGRKKQALLSREERMTLSPWHFALYDRDKVIGKKILLLDDVITTGSTLRALTALLYEGGARQVYGLALAEAQLYDDF